VANGETCFLADEDAQEHGITGQGHGSSFLPQIQATGIAAVTLKATLLRIEVIASPGFDNGCETSDE
jgi:hypothetical protein